MQEEELEENVRRPGVTTRSAILAVMIAALCTTPADAQFRQNGAATRESSAKETAAPVGLSNGSGWRASFGFISFTPHSIYRGGLQIQHKGQTFGPGYDEDTAFLTGFEAGAAIDTEQFGKLHFNGFLVTGTSTGRYQGLQAPESQTRDLTTIGIDLGWSPIVWSKGSVELRVPFGPSVLRQTLALSDGHRNAYGDPDGFTSVQVNWRDRSWVSVGGHGGLVLRVALSSELRLRVNSLARFLFYEGTGWSGQEEQDVLESTGNTVSIQYRDPMVLLSSLEAGFEWSPKR